MIYALKVSLVMVIGCKGICDKFLTSGGGMISRYRLGFKRCTECGLFIKYEGT